MLADDAELASSTSCWAPTTSVWTPKRAASRSGQRNTSSTRAGTPTIWGTTWPSSLCPSPSPGPVSSWKSFSKQNQYRSQLHKLLENSQISDTISPICLPASDGNQYVGTLATLSGWGRPSDCKSHPIVRFTIQIHLACGTLQTKLDILFPNNTKKIDIVIIPLLAESVKLVEVGKQKKEMIDSFPSPSKIISLKKLLLNYHFHHK